MGSRWEREIDWMAMMGINMPLAFTGQEYVWDRVYRERFNLSEADLAEHFAGPAFLAWGRMDNIRGWGGWMDATNKTLANKGLTANWMKQQADLQRWIVARERNLGMKTVLPGFAGHVPLALGQQAQVSRSPGWFGFHGRYGEVGLLEAADPLFWEVGSAFIEIQTEEFGTDHFYNADTFNEMRPVSTDAAYVSVWGTAVYGAMAAADPDAVWFVQGWSLHGWADDELAAYWSSVPQGRLLSLDLNCAQNGGSWKKYTEQVSPPRPVVCGLLDNMGGKRALGGNLASISGTLLNNIAAAGEDDQGTQLIAALGWNPEDLHQNPVKWHLMGEVGWRNASHRIDDIGEWVRKYAAARYVPHGDGELIASAWDALRQAAYRGSNHATGPAANGICNLPGFHNGFTYSSNVSGVITAVRLLVEAAMRTPDLRTVDSFRYDLVDSMRQALQDHFAGIYKPLADVCADGITQNASCQQIFDDSSQKILDLAADLDALLATDRHFLLGRWIRDARSWGATASESDWLEWNARVQITLWGTVAGNGARIANYAEKQWAGLVSSYHLPLWREFFSRVGAGANPNSLRNEMLEQAEKWTNSTEESFATEPVGDAVDTTLALVNKWFSPTPLV